MDVENVVSPAKTSPSVKKSIISLDGKEIDPSVFRQGLEKVNGHLKDVTILSGSQIIHASSGGHGLKCVEFMNENGVIELPKSVLTASTAQDSLITTGSDADVEDSSSDEDGKGNYNKPTPPVKSSMFKRLWGFLCCGGGNIGKEDVNGTSEGSIVSVKMPKLTTRKQRHTLSSRHQSGLSHVSSYDMSCRTLSVMIDVDENGRDIVPEEPTNMITTHTIRQARVSLNSTVESSPSKGLPPHLEQLCDELESMQGRAIIEEVEEEEQDEE